MEQSSRKAPLSKLLLMPPLGGGLLQVAAILLKKVRPKVLISLHSE